MNSDYRQELLNQVGALTDVVASQAATITKLTATNTKLTETVAILSVENAALKAGLNQNSKNSSKHPSSDGRNKPKSKSLRKSSDKKQGAQPGHEGKGFSITQTPDERIQHILFEVYRMSQRRTSVALCISDTRYEVDIQRDTKVTVHQVLSFVCQRENGTIITANFPDLITARMQYDDRVF